MNRLLILCAALSSCLPSGDIPPEIEARALYAYEGRCPRCPLAYIHQLHGTGYGEVRIFAGSAVEVVYDPDWLGRAHRDFGFGAALGILCHELGHGVAWHERNGEPQEQRQWEIDADREAGCMLAIDGTPPDALMRWLSVVLASGDVDHPPGAERAAAVGEGWEHCR